MAYGSGDLARFFADFGEVIVFGTYTCKGHLALESDLITEGGDMTVMGLSQSLQFPSASLPGLKRGSALTVGGTSFKVREVRKQDDGALSVAFLETP